MALKFEKKNEQRALRSIFKVKFPARRELFLGPVLNREFVHSKNKHLCFLSTRRVLG